MEQYYNDLEKALSMFVGFLNNYGRSTALQDYAIQEFTSFFYANMISNFFRNLTAQNVKELQLPVGQIKAIKRSYQKVLKEVRAALSIKGKRVDAKYYSAFKSDLTKEYPKLLKLIEGVEETIEINKADDYLTQKEKIIRKSGKTQTELQDVFATIMLEAFVKKEHRLPNTQEISRLVKKVNMRYALRRMARPVIKELDRSSSDMLSEQGLYRAGFEARLHKRWHEPLDLLECLIKIATETGEEKAILLTKSADEANKYQRSALIQIHARAIQIANEILTLLRTGYADGANARWRSLYELVVIASFLREQNNSVAERYLAHDIMKQFKEAKDYQQACRKLGYSPLKRSELNTLQKQHDALIAKYGSEFEYQTGYDWVLAATIGKTNGRKVSFRDLEDQVKFSKWRPFYNLSSNAIHSGPRGFFRLGLIHQTEMLLAGPSNFGLADTLQNTAISLSQVSIFLLTIQPGLENLLVAEAIDSYSHRIGISATRIQNRIEKEDQNIRSSKRTR
jgi:hypothetical protein